MPVFLSGGPHNCPKLISVIKKKKEEEEEQRWKTNIKYPKIVGLQKEQQRPNGNTRRKIKTKTRTEEIFATIMTENLSKSISDIKPYM